MKLLKNPESRYGNPLMRAINLAQKNPNSKKAKALMNVYYKNLLQDAVATGATTGVGINSVLKLIELLK